ncbi:MAG: alanine--glyoxylate aminotransferase family protein [Cytophagales bacterium]|nr:alanine--glyoxylate aminotransferase family protein [Cytophagales bacterium]
MPLITFYPGPSKVYPQVREFMQDAYDQGVLSLNHRSGGFMDICRRAIEGLKTKLAVPPAYPVLLVSSATECWEIIAQSLTARESFHVYNGAFGEKWLEYARRLRPGSTGYSFGTDEALPPEAVPVPETAEVICLTQNETANGTQVSIEVIRRFKVLHPDRLVAVDATSSLGGLALDFTAADVWFASVQKCLGLPAGLGILICSPQALERGGYLGDRAFYNSLMFVHENFRKFQTPYTPNVLGIYLLSRVVEMIEPIASISSRLERQASDWYAFLEPLLGLQPLVRNAAVRSATVVAVEAPQVVIAPLKEGAKREGLVLGNGYGAWKDTTFRIANFPALTAEEIGLLRNFLWNASRG